MLLITPFLLAGCFEYHLGQKDTAAPGDDAPPDTAPLVDTAPPPDTAPPATCDDFPPPAPYAAGLDEACTVDPILDTGTLDAVVEWRWDTNPLQPGYEQVLSAPTVANLDDDDGDGDIDAYDDPEIIFNAWEEWYNSDSALTVIRGRDGSTVWSVLAPAGEMLYASGGVAVGDLEGDGSPDICVAGVTHAVVCVEADGTFKWGGGDVTSRYGTPALADLDADGRSEVIYGPLVLDADGNPLGQAPEGMGEYSFLSVPIDLDGDGWMEVVNGSLAFHADGGVLWSVPDSETFPAVADLDGDGSPDVVSTGDATVTVRDNHGTLLWSQPHPGDGPGGPAAIGDLDGDGAPEIAVGNKFALAVFEADGSPAWTAPTCDPSTGLTGTSLFDFDGDGALEVLYADEETLQVFSGRDGAVRLRYDAHSSRTIFEYPVVADVDRDGSAEIVLPSNDYYRSGSRGITALGPSTAWAGARPTWNEYAFHDTNVGDDGRVPVGEPPHWEAGNTFRAMPAHLPTGAGQPDLAPGAPTTCPAECDADRLTLWIPVENRGTAEAGPHEVTLVARHGTAEHVTWRQDIAGLGPQATVILGPFVLTRDEWGDTLEVRVDGPDAVPECHEDGNVLDLGPWGC